MGNYNAAIADIEIALGKGDEVAYYYANIGLAKIKLGNIEEGLKDIDHAMMLDPNEAYVYRSKGIYYMDGGDKKLALEYFEKARRLNAACYQIEMLVASAR